MAGEISFVGYNIPYVADTDIDWKRIVVLDVSSTDHKVKYPTSYDDMKYFAGVTTLKAIANERFPVKAGQEIIVRLIAATDIPKGDYIVPELNTGKAVALSDASVAAGDYISVGIAEHAATANTDVLVRIRVMPVTKV